jgi:hypothetical protein
MPPKSVLTHVFMYVLPRSRSHVHITHCHRYDYLNRFNLSSNLEDIEERRVCVQYIYNNVKKFIAKQYSYYQLSNIM